MRLKCIKLAGFKSFVDPTTVNFPSNLCAIVGPNGCGKSNIIDAVRWVLGESSAKNLRGEQMTDVIFNGAAGRKPVGQASIELIFDNTDNRIKGEYAQYNEISIKRRVSRDAQSYYYLNGTKCRRRDITDIFLGTGLGPRSYSIIEQGMVSRLIESKPEDLRVFIEEAAGISKYKERRRDTENRIKRTRDNLERLTDIRDELGRQLQHLQRQAQEAEKYSEFKKLERESTSRLRALRWQSLDQELSGKQSIMQGLEVEVEACMAEHRAVDAEIAQHLEDNTECNERYNEVQATYYELGSEISRVEQSIQHQIERGRQLEEDLRETDQGWQEAKQEMDVDLAKVASLSDEIATIEPQLLTAQEGEEASSVALDQAEEHMHQWQHEWDEFNSAAAKPMQIAEVEQSRIQQLEKIIERGMERKQKLQQESSSIGLAPGETEEGKDEGKEEGEEIEELGLQQLALQQHLEQCQEQNDQLFEQIEQQRNSGNVIIDQLDQARSELQTLRGRGASLQALQQAALGKDNDSVINWLESSQLQNNRRLVENLTVAGGWEIAVESVLGEQLQAVCVDGFSTLEKLFKNMPEGTLSFIDTNMAASATNNNNDEAKSRLAKVSLLVDKVAFSVDSNIDTGALLAGVYAVEELSEALGLRSQLADDESVVTKAGIWIGKTWLRVSSKAVDSSAGVIQRKEELNTVAEKIAQLEERIEQLLQQQEQGQSQLSESEQGKEQLQQQISQVNRQVSEVKSQLSAMQVKLEQTTLRRQHLQQELADLVKQLGIEQENIAAAKGELTLALDSMEENTESREDLLRQRDECRGILDQARQKARYDKDIAHQLALRQQSVATQLQSTREAMDRMAIQVQRSKSRSESLRVMMEESKAPTEELKRNLERNLEQRLAVESRLSEAKAKVDANDHALRQLEKKRGRAEENVQGIREKLVENRLQCEGSVVKRNALMEQLRESNYDLDTVLKNIPAGHSEQQCQEDLERLANRIQRLGAINLAAVDEFKQQSARKTYLDAQNADLEKALHTLENAIRKIDKETRTRFRETFDKVNVGLQELFPKVFGGGHAYLAMTGDDLLDTGVAIMARPPGKRNSTIHLLSGGEKAMTAIALVFAIFRLNPSPFCMLDEVDAPLDDANVQRYARLVKEMAIEVQFIFITHNKGTMEMARQLLGVTMNEPGVSRLVAVDIDEAAELAAM